MPRTQATFDFVYRLAGQQLHSDAGWHRLHYHAGAAPPLMPQDAQPVLPPCGSALVASPPGLPTQAACLAPPPAQ